MSWQPGRQAVAQRGWLVAHKWLLWRRAAQLFFIAIFLIGPLTGFWLVKGNLAASMTLGVLPLSDPFILLQSLLAGHLPGDTALIGGAIVVTCYLAIGGRVFCSWVCPVNVITDLAHWLRRQLGLGRSSRLGRNSRYWVMAMVLVTALATGSIAWELVNPVTIVFRGLVFGLGLGWAVALAVFLFDLFVSDRGWCSRLCPVGAFYSLLGHTALVRVGVMERQACNDCMDCYAVCPEPQVIAPALKGVGGAGPLILAANCTNCGRCIDVCAPRVFAFRDRHGFGKSSSGSRIALNQG